MTGRPPHSTIAVAVPKGYRVGRWEVGEHLASGAFASVYAARRVAGPAGPGQGVGLPRRAALKFLPTGTRTTRQLRHLQELAERELALHRRLRHPRLIRMYEALTVDDAAQPGLDGATVLVLEQAETSLDELLARSPRPPTGPALLAQICEGLHQLHHAGWVHGDLKTANVLLMADGSARLGDFNMAAEMDGTHAYTAAFATPDYTPPELLWAEMGEHGQQIRPTADIWAFGVLAHVVLTGSPPLPGGTPAARRDAAVRYARGADDLRLSAELPAEWRQIVTDCLARTHEERAGQDTASLLRRVEEAAGAARSAKLPRLGSRFRFRRGRGLRPAYMAAIAATGAAALAVALTTALREEPVTYGYHRCEAGSVCFFSERNGNGLMCSWRGNDKDWRSGRETCEWSRTRNVRSVFNNDQESRTTHDLAFYWERDWRPKAYGDDRAVKGDARIGCSTVNTQGNLTGEYAPLSHRWITHC
ncbi:protein kinase [Streptomyces sp. ISL-98]|uniref:serine/threonine-protein kinase n=1 Tax=Streptomyces sp. ISL-98 TaxID=2819192 RepID=UPI001BE718D1|nr:serine/threonine-protein kinase [Streptomyces sp. ISL-98]MBT2507174.1 protein kinase [Streptomyces sp. ISL-98]